MTDPLYNQISEKIFTAQVLKMARMFGWLAYHARPAMSKRGRWITAMSGDVGFPDCVFIKPGRVIFAELKAERGRLTPAQEKWLEVAKAAGIQACLWRPKDIDQIERILRG